MPLFLILRQILRCLDGSLVNVLYDVLMFRYVIVIRCSDGRQLLNRRYPIRGGRSGESLVLS